MVPYLAPFSGDAGATAVCKEFHAACFQEAQAREMAPVEEEEGEDLCNCEFSLAYGGKILLNNARLHLKRGQRYGLCGPNGAGKSTLMRAIGECSCRARGGGPASVCHKLCEALAMLRSRTDGRALVQPCTRALRAMPPSPPAHPAASSRVFRPPQPTASWTASRPSLSCAPCTSSTTSTPPVRPQGGHRD